MTSRSYTILTTAVAIASASCAAAPPRARIQLTAPGVLCKDPTMDGKAFCLPAASMEKLLDDADMTILQSREPKHGTTGARVFVLEFPSAKVIVRAKWKEANRGGDGINNDPRKELAAYAFQKLLLEPAEYVIPPTVGRCIPLDYYDIAIKRAKPTLPTFANTGCVFGTFSYWLENAGELDGFDRKRFAADKAYRWTVANLNLVTHLINHRDTRPSNFLMSSDHDNPRAFAIDNGLAFSGLTNPRTLFLREWSKLMVPSVPHQQIERLRKLHRADLDKLAVVAQFAVSDKQIDPVEPTESLSGSSGVRRSGNIIQMGLTKSEIDGIDERIKALLKGVDSGKIQVF